MAKHVLLNNIAHKDLKIITQYSARFGDNLGSTLTFPTEFGDIQREYPILFRKESANGKFQSVVLLGFKPDENLFLDEFRGWQADYIPAVIERGPFLIGFQDQRVDGGSERAPVVHVDLDNPRVSEIEGKAVFLEHGGISPYLDRINQLLLRIYEGMQISDAMFDAFLALDLLEPVTLEIQINEREQYCLQGNYTISASKLAALGDKDIAHLHRSGFLRCAYLAMESLGNIQRLIQLKNTRT
ncbi:peptide ABC transporter permease [Cellvibrio mixtus]|uniref:Peptide ABC transporter permease n=1 Tax=Cellvibrio mixtus TaxID=39650 RepID=A0A266QBT6_9GAMM|nr:MULTISPECIES: SapC family protein [Cellvibrio]AQT60996.1 peptide ABC transporter permease [Cellvibrio sp. PSBB023]OZY87305.1 peptide ABC transporter permease [Cellvibrio mixtus]